MAEPEDMIVPLLREMRAENARLHGATAEKLDRVDARLNKLEEQMTSFRQALTADTMMGKLVTGDFEEGIEALERRVRELERSR